MSEISIGTWNTLNAFGDEALSEARFYDALEMVKRMDADVLAMPETTVHGVHDSDLERERLEMLRACMAGQGYIGEITDYTPIKGERNAHNMSLWTRLDHTTQPQSKVFGNRYGLSLTVRGMNAKIQALHQHDCYPNERVLTAKAAVADALYMAGGASEADLAGEPDQAIIAGDLNDIYHDDPRALPLRVIGKLVNGLEVSDYYDSSKRFQRLAGKVIRTCRMSGGDSLKVFTEAEFHDADPLRQPTIGSGRVAFQLDHILGTPGIDFADFTVHDRGLTPDSKPLSDHSPITARAIRQS